MMKATMTHLLMEDNARMSMHGILLLAIYNTVHLPVQEDYCILQLKVMPIM